MGSWETLLHARCLKTSMLHTFRTRRVFSSSWLSAGCHPQRSQLAEVHRAPRPPLFTKCVFDPSSKIGFPIVFAFLDLSKDLCLRSFHRLFSRCVASISTSLHVRSIIDVHLQDFSTVVLSPKVLVSGTSTTLSVNWGCGTSVVFY